MPIKQVTPKQVILNATNTNVQMLGREVLRRLASVGEQAKNEARLSHTYKDQTGNLTASMGFETVANGSVVVLGDFDKVAAPKGDGGEGTSVGRHFAEDMAARFPSGMALVVVAGMPYAKYLEAKGYNVLDSAFLLSKKLVPQMLRDLGFKL